MALVVRARRRIKDGMNGNVRRFLKIVAVTLGCLVGLFGVIQIVPYGRTHSNPRVVQEPPWVSPRTRELAKRACFDCHSNETRWPRYANVAPFSWVVQQDVEAARSITNFSEWNVPYDLAASSSQSIYTGNMPPVKYRMAHPEADLNLQERLELARGLDATLNVPARH